ncbi:ABC transporter substrate-binding protein [Roseiflexus sp.]|uniref:ABC transporter substrate-binding protein n=1 Tax=Roseiflexus sp. TaxID=2562120 RepID=UPI00398B96E1
MDDKRSAHTGPTERRLNRRAFLRLVAAGGGALALQACGGAATPVAPTTAPAAPTTAPAAPTTAPAAPTTAPAAPTAPGGSVTWAMLGDPVSLEPYGINITGQYNYEAREPAYDSLLVWDRDLKVQPSLAESFETPDDTTYIFKLRSGVKFHNGKELTAEDVKFSLDTIINPPDGRNPGAAFFANFDTVEVVDPLTIRINLKKLDPTIPGLFAWSRYTNVFPADMPQQINPVTQAIGTGPFRVVSYTPNAEIVYERFLDHWNPEQPKIDRLTYRIIPEEDARIAALRSGDIDGTDVTPLGARRLQNDADITVLKGLFSQPKVLQFTLKGGKPWDIKEVRQAISLTIDRQELIDKVMEGEAELTGPVVPGYGAWPLSQDELRAAYQVDVAKARQLMAQAGYADGFKVTAMTFTGYTNDNAIIVQEQLRQLNIDMQIEQIEFGTFAQRVTNGEFEWCFTARGMRADVSGYLNDFRRLGIAEKNWFPAWENAELNEAYDAAMATLDQAKRRELMQKVQRIVIDEAPHLYLYQDYRFSAVRKRVQNYYVAFTTFRPALREIFVTA